MLKMTTEASVRAFLSSPHFAVVGVSTNTAKFGYKVFAWYKAYGLPVTPINRISKSIPVGGVDHATVPTLSDLPNPKETSLSIITPPPATMELLREARDLGIPAVWMQPGTWNDEVMSFARGETEDGYKGEVVAGEGGRGHGGWCVLVDGEKGLQAVGKL